jgi:hypothetical protein
MRHCKQVIITFADFEKRNEHVRGSETEGSVWGLSEKDFLDKLEEEEE